MLKKKETIIFFSRNKKKYPFKLWYISLEKNDKYRVSERIKRIEDGNYGDYGSVGNGILELRFSQGFRIYFTELDNTIVLLFCGGNKSTQQKDIEKAKEYKVMLNENGLENCTN